MNHTNKANNFELIYNSHTDLRIRSFANINDTSTLTIRFTNKYRS